MTDNLVSRYEIADGDKSWEDAERQIREAGKASGLGKSTVVSVKSSKPAKRKVDEAHSGKNEGGERKERKKKRPEKHAHG
jgi:hypothetical protein